MRADELAQLRVTVTILGALERVESPAQLDAQRYGVIVAAAGGRRGLLLPAIPGIDSVGEQLSIAREKGGIGPDEPIEIRRFTARTFGEVPGKGG